MKSNAYKEYISKSVDFLLQNAIKTAINWTFLMQFYEHNLFTSIIPIR